MGRGKFVGRDDVYNLLKKWLSEEQESKVRVISVEGPGGIGKTTLIKQVLDSVDLNAKFYLNFEIEGGCFRPDEELNDPISILSRICNDVKQKELPDTSEPYFIMIQKLKEANDELKKESLNRINKLADKFSEDTKNELKRANRMGGFSGKVIPKLKIKELSEAEMDQLIQDIESLKKKGLGIISRILNLFRKNKKIKDQLENDVWNIMAEDFYIDLEVILSGWKKGAKKKIHKYMPEKVPGKDNLFLFIDDYESIQNDFGKNLFVRNFFPKLLKATFKTTLLISGRDKLDLTEPGWNRMFSQELRKHTIQLNPLSEADIKELLNCYNFKGDLDVIVKNIFKDTEGYPLLVDIALEDYGKEGLPVVSLKKFFDRQTNWMTKIQKKWLGHLSFLDVINIETIPKVLPEEDPNQVFEWFESEGSIRDTNSPKWVIRPFVRSRVKDYFKSKKPSEFDKLTKMASSETLENNKNCL